MRTTYIANDMEERRQQRSAEKSGVAGTEDEAIDRDAQIAAIEVDWSCPCCAHTLWFYLLHIPDLECLKVAKFFC